MFSKIGTGEIIVILIVALLVFGPDKLPQAARSLGRAVRDFKKFMNETTEELKEAVGEIEYIGQEISSVGAEVKSAVDPVGESSSKERIPVEESAISVVEPAPDEIGAQSVEAEGSAEEQEITV